MKALLDENMPRALAQLLAPEIDALTVQQMGWSGLKNGELLKRAEAKFDLLITTDQGIPHQQNLDRFDIRIVLLEANSNRAEDLAVLVPVLKSHVTSALSDKVLRIR